MDIISGINCAVNENQCATTSQNQLLFYEHTCPCFQNIASFVYLDNIMDHQSYSS